MKLYQKYIVLIFLVLATGFQACTNKNGIVINVEEYGIKADTQECIVAQINQLIENLDEQPTTIVFPKGRYDFYPDSNYLRPYFETNTYDVNPKRLGILLDKKSNITIDGQGSEFIYHGHIQPFTLDHSSNITLKNINIDWDIPLTAESEVMEASSSHLLLKIDTKQFPFELSSQQGIDFVGEDWKENWQLSQGSWLIEIDQNHIIPAYTGGHGSVKYKGDKELKYTLVDDGLLKIEGQFTKTPTVGNRLIMRHSTRDHAGIFLFHSKDLLLENINVYHTSGLGILSQYCENIEMRQVHMIPNPAKNRFLSGHDDGLHFMGCKGGIVIDSCKAQGLMDDPINIHGTCVPVVEKIDATTVRCRFAHGMSTGLIWAQPGDSLSFIHKKSMKSIGLGTISSFEPESKDVFVLKFKEEVPSKLDANYSIENLSWIPNVKITNCFAGSCRARGYLISTPGEVVIENNVFETSGSAILIAGDANYWYESGAVRDVTIRNNEFRWPCNSSHYQFCNAIISIYPEVPEPDSEQPFHQNITIEHNHFNPSDYLVLYALSVDGLSFKNNTISRTYNYQPWHFQKHTFLLDACKNVEISRNIIEDDVLGKNILLKRMSQDELRLGNAELTVEVKDAD
ncbi:right-handed parallel beta-helix repeat-containing protein [Carboxylicivirga marina]|uniref:Right-handed parallel beta-helix repeat-containing protein n=1 Tax=Carboxylicivirga marina TaxID=2800988 RepID=A0ABS1HPS5_9BACT|nr:right-handed parallel beta-helix repeat-containing protein [Carboxylicivirga marina]MBK3519670.1 right-handed parallel beta-helix repeat-containing protein [Carboxylicivirga marina]